MFLSHGQRINWCSGNILEGLIVLSINVIKTIFSDLFLSSSVVDKVNTRSQTRHDWRKTASLQGSNQAAALARQSAAKRIDPSQVLYAYDQFWSEMLVLLVFFVKKGSKISKCDVHNQSISFHFSADPLVCKSSKTNSHSKILVKSTL